jgi:RimJ/RimL family protein N-acetyltransferase
MLKGNKVILRPVKRADIPNFLIWFNDPDVTQYLRMYLPMTEMAEEKWVECLGSDLNSVIFVIESTESEVNKPIGSTGFSNIASKDRDAEFGIAIGDKTYWGKGIGTEAAQLMIKYGFEKLNLNRISSNVYDFNLRSQKMHLKIGFKPEGRRRKAHFTNGAYRDVLEYGILSQEWKRLNNNEKSSGT